MAKSKDGEFKYEARFSDTPAPVPTPAQRRGFYRPHKRVQIDTEALGGPSMTRQEFAEECDINTIMDRYKAGGVVSHVNKAQPHYGDFAEVPDFQTSLEVHQRAVDAFMALPAKVRAEFDNDAGKFVDYVDRAGEPELEQLRSWGLVNVPEVPPAPMKVEIVEPPGAAPKGSESPSK